MVRATPLIPPPCTDIGIGEGRTVRLGPQLGRGSMATVYRGDFEGPFGLRRPVAVKVFDVVATDEHEAVLEALTSAARRSAAVHHPNVVQVEDLGMLGPAQPYVVEELVEGRALASFIATVTRRQERLPLDLALFVGIEIAEALAGARLACSTEGVRMGVVHGELSPGDVLLSWHGEVKVSDFGFGAAARAASSVRSVGALARRVGALAPEVVCGRLGDARSDVFSLGVMLREMLVGPRFPSFVTEQQAVVWARDGVVHHGLFEPHLPEPVHTVVARALQPDPALRYPHAGALVYELRRAALALGVGEERAFLGAALSRAFGREGRRADDEVTSELRAPRPSGVVVRAADARETVLRAADARETVDRFARLRGEERDADDDEDDTDDAADV